MTHKDLADLLEHAAAELYNSNPVHQLLREKLTKTAQTLRTCPKASLPEPKAADTAEGLKGFWGINNPKPEDICEHLFRKDDGRFFRTGYGFDEEIEAHHIRRGLLDGLGPLEWVCHDCMDDALKPEDETLGYPPDELLRPTGCTSPQPSASAPGRCICGVEMLLHDSSPSQAKSGKSIFANPNYYRGFEGKPCEMGEMPRCEHLGFGDTAFRLRRPDDRLWQLCSVCLDEAIEARESDDPCNRPTTLPEGGNMHPGELEPVGEGFRGTSGKRWHALAGEELEAACNRNGAALHKLENQFHAHEESAKEGWNESKKDFNRLEVQLEDLGVDLRGRVLALELKVERS